MPRKKPELTWFPPRTCWSKFYRGKRYYCPIKTAGKGDRSGYEKSLEWWYQHKASIDNAPLSRQLEVSPSTLPAGLGIDPAGAVALATDYRKGGILSVSVTSLPPDERRIVALMETYLSKKRRDAETGQISFKMYGEHKLTLDDFLGFCDLYGSKKGKPITTVFQIDSELLWSYQATQFDYASREKKSDGKISLRTVRKRLASASRFVKWLEVGGAIDQLPKALKDKNYASVELPDPVPVFFTPDECRRLFVNASQRTKLYIALGLNCGYTQSDIASLTHGMVNWDSGIIDRKRHKTKVSQWHSLWPITLKLLSAEKTKGAKDELILRGENGNPLLTDKINSAKNVSGTDVIKLAFERVKKKLGMKDDRRGFAVFRKTGSNEIERWYPELTEHFLAHAEPGLKRHYVKRHYDELHLAIQRLDRDVFKLSECC